MPVRLREPLATEAIAVRHGDRLRVLVANLTDQERVIELAGPLATVSVRALDETTYAKAATDATFFRDPGGEHIEARDGRLQLALRPFAVARLDAFGG